MNKGRESHTTASTKLLALTHEKILSYISDDGDTMLSQIVHMVAEARRSRAPIQKLADKMTGWFVPVVIGVAMLSLLAFINLLPQLTCVGWVLNSSKLRKISESRRQSSTVC